MMPADWLWWLRAFPSHRIDSRVWLTGLQSFHGSGCTYASACMPTVVTVTYAASANASDQG